MSTVQPDARHEELYPGATQQNLHSIGMINIP